MISRNRMSKAQQRLARAKRYAERAWINDDLQAVATSGWLNGYAAAMREVKRREKGKVAAGVKHV